ncbi:MAG: tRNA (adenosine(37)-N6)-dimethylallyltransferase MiaA [Planctomycetes bacterium]|nr:tRNA (adenosine(37)-N6)-dimethylallyltransferase MiaA [Planctomycetota bacterium]
MSHSHGPNPNARHPVLVILGPTASGKSRLALAVARRAGGEIISVDALKVYRGMNAGTAKPDAAQRAEIPHHGIDLVEPHEEFSVARFLDWVEPVLAAGAARGRLPILDTTAPYYLKALVYGIARGPRPQPAFRDEMEKRPLAELFAALVGIDPVAAARIGPNDRKRLIRALEIAQFSDAKPSDAPRWAEPRGDYRWVFTGISWPRELLNQRVEARARQMFASGWLDEVRRIRQQGGFSRTAGLAHGYRRLQQYLDGALTLAEAEAQTIADVRQFARKSMTFFRGFPRVQWLEVTSEEEIDRAAMYLSHELKEMLAEVGISRKPVDLP